MTEVGVSVARSPLAGEGRGGGLATSRHIVRRAGDSKFAVPDELAAHSAGFRRWSIVDESTPAVHTGFGIVALDAGGALATHVHSFEESFYILEGEPEIQISEGEFRLRTGDYGFVPVGAPHSWRAPPHAGGRWAEMVAPQARAGHGHDTYVVAGGDGEAGVAVDVRDPRTRSFGHIEPSNMDVSLQTQEHLAVSASMRTALLVYSGITVKMMVDRDLGAQLSTMFMVQYEPNGKAGAHDHPFEETYLILDGWVDATFDGQRYHMTAGDVAFAGVGCVHSFSNPANQPVRWLETQAPQPPARYSYRFARDWDYLQSRIPSRDSQIPSPSPREGSENLPPPRAGEGRGGG
jgi:quercetin dioxygenase-like cupin family protein